MNEIATATASEYDALKAVLARPDAKQQSAGFWVWTWVFWAAAVAGPFLPLAALAVPPEYETVQNVVPAVKWMAVGVFLFGGVVFLFLYLVYMISVGLHDLDRDDETTRKENNEIASLVVVLGLARRLKPREQVRTVVNVLAVFALYAAACYTSGTLVLLVIVGMKFARFFSHLSYESWLGKLPRSEVVRLLRRPWETKDTSDPPEFRQVQPVIAQ